MLVTGKRWATLCRTCPSANWSTTNPKWKSLESNPKLRSEKPVTNSLRHGSLKGKVRLTIGHGCPEREYRYSSILSLTSALDGGGWLTPRPGRFTPGKETWYPFYRRLGGPQCRFGRARKISPPPGFDLRTVQPIASRHTDCAVPAHSLSHSPTFFCLVLCL
jgi:hypothetical protein